MHADISEWTFAFNMFKFKYDPHVSIMVKKHEDNRYDLKIPVHTNNLRPWMKETSFYYHIKERKQDDKEFIIPFIETVWTQNIRKDE